MGSRYSIVLASILTFFQSIQGLSLKKLSTFTMIWVNTDPFVVSSDRQSSLWKEFCGKIIFEIVNQFSNLMQYEIVCIPNYENKVTQLRAYTMHYTYSSSKLSTRH